MKEVISIRLVEQGKPDDGFKPFLAENRVFPGAKGVEDLVVIEARFNVFPVRFRVLIELLQQLRHKSMVK